MSEASHPRVCVAPSPKVRGLATLNGVGAGTVEGVGADGRSLHPLRVMPFKELFCTDFSTDAHFATYLVEVGGRVAERCPRLRKEALPQLREAGARVFHEVVAVDHDLKDLLGSKDKLPWSSLAGEQTADVRRRIRDAWDHLHARELEWSHFYATRNGFRTVHQLALPVPPEGYERLVQRLLAAYRVAGLAPDVACKDWTRLFRCPRVTRPS